MSRSLTLVNRHLGGIISAPQPGPAEHEVQKHAEGLADAVRALIPRMRLNGALEEILQFVRRLNRYFNDQQPWALAKNPQARERLDTVLYTTIEGLRITAVLLEPAMPAKCSTLLSALGVQTQSVRDGARWGLMPPGTVVDSDPPILFPRIDTGNQAWSTKPQAEPTKTKGKEPKVSDDNLISFEEFGRVDLRVAEVLTAERVPKTDRLLKLGVCIGAEERTIVAGIATSYEPEQMIGRKVILVANLKPAKLRGIESQGMLLAAEDDAGHLSLVEVPSDTSSGAKVK